MPASPSLPAGAGATRALSISQLADKVQQHAGQWRLERLVVPGDPRQAARAELIGPAGERQLLFIDPYSAEPIGSPQRLDDRSNLPPGPALAVLLVLLYLAGCAWTWRNWRQRHRTAEPHPTPQLLIAYASQGGQGERLARLSAERLHQGGTAVQLRPLNQIDSALLARAQHVLFVLSTYGEGEAPDNGAQFAARLLGTSIGLGHLHFGLLALGDSRYPHFCGFAHRVHDWLHSHGAQPLFDAVWADRLAPQALDTWQQYLGDLGARPAAPGDASGFSRWQLVHRQWLNTDSPGGAVFHLGLHATDERAAWQAGDIAEIAPCNSPEQVARFAAHLQLDTAQQVAGRPLASHLANRLLPGDNATRGTLVGLEASALLARLTALPTRDYSIASVPADGRLELVVRQATRADGSPGLGSGWLCQHAALGGEVALRVRRNQAFHAPASAVPMILIGSGTGIAGLRAHLRERSRAGENRNWLLFGERSPVHDRLFQAELQSWQATGHLQRLDLAFSRGDTPRYVQHVLASAADELHRWLASGAVLYLCGSLSGMGQGVESALRRLLGEAQLQQLIDSGRYRRDLY